MGRRIRLEPMQLVLFDLEGKKTDFAYNVQERLYPASTTKIMTALLAIENADLEDKVTISANADARTFAADESTCGIKEGDEMTLEDLLNGLLLHSGNDNAVAIAEHGSGSIEEFAKLMNERAESLMATGTHFTNPSGLHDENHYTTAYDLYLIFNECIKHPEFVGIIQSSSYTANIKGADGTLRQETWEPSHFYAQGEAVPPENASIIGGKIRNYQACWQLPDSIRRRSEWKTVYFDCNGSGYKRSAVSGYDCIDRRDSKLRKGTAFCSPLFMGECRFFHTN